MTRRSAAAQPAGCRSAGRRRAAAQSAAVRVLAAVGAVLALLLTGAAPALAHASLVGETPADGATVRGALGTVVLRFDENIRQPSVVIVTGPGGERVDSGATTVLDNTASVAVVMRERGRYTVSCRVLSGDGHPVSDQTTFTYHGPPSTGSRVAAGATGSGTSSGGEGPRGTVWVAAGVVVASLVVVALLLVGRRRQPPASDTGEDLAAADDQPRSSL